MHRHVGVADDLNAAADGEAFEADYGEHRVKIPGTQWFSVRDGVITRRVDSWDSLTFLEQTGQYPLDR